MKPIDKQLLMLWFWVAQPTLAQSRPVAMPNQRGLIDVFALRQTVSRLETLPPKTDEERCETQNCRVNVCLEKQRFEKARATFMRTRSLHY